MQSVQCTIYNVHVPGRALGLAFIISIGVPKSANQNLIITEVKKCIGSSGKKSKSVFDFSTYSRETCFSFYYKKVENLFGLIEA